MGKAGMEGCVRVYNEGGRDMLHRGSIVVSVVLAICLVASQVSAEVFAYPKKGQSQQQFEQDQFGCHQWASLSQSPTRRRPRSLPTFPVVGNRCRFPRCHSAHMSPLRTTTCHRSD